MDSNQDEVGKVRGAVSQTADGSRFVAMFAIVGTMLSALAVFVYAAAVVGISIWDAVTAGTPGEHQLKILTMSLIETMDAFLFGTVLYIASIGFFQLFIDPHVTVPAWMRIENLDQLKAKLIGVVVVLLAVSFLGRVSEWDGSQDILQLGIAIALVIMGLGYFGFKGHEPE